jgi:hypothetical protein
MPQKSGISLTVVPPVLPGARPAPPPELDTVEAEVWRTIAAGLPPTWIDSAAQQLLRRACAQGAVCEDLEAQLRALRAQSPRDTDAIATLVVQHAAAAKVMSMLLTSLRATPRSRIVSRDASRQSARMRRVRLWEAVEEADR